MAVFHEKKAPARTIVATIILIGISLVLLVSCHPAKPYFSPLPAHIISIEGYASLRLSRSGETAKSRFSFIFVLPDRGRVEVYDPLGRTASILFLDSGEAFFVLPTKRAYWRTGREEALTKLLGFDLSPEEIINILSGKTEEMEGWDLERDVLGRAVQGQRGALRFEVRQFYGQTSLPQVLALSRGEERGNLKILRLNFNQPLKAAVFDLSFLKDGAYKPSTWEEIGRWVRDEN